MAENVTPEFIAEAQEIVDALNSGLIAVEASVRADEEISPDQINDLFRNAHSLKGISGMFGLEQMTRLAHALEGVLDGMRLGKVRIDAQALDVLFGCVETFGHLVAASSKGDEIDERQLGTILGRLERVAQGQPEGGEVDPLQQAGLDEGVLAVLTEYEEHRLRENLRRGRGLYLLRTSFDLSNFDVGLAELDGVVKKLGEVITKLPSSETTDPGTISFDIIVGSDKSADELSHAIGDDRVEVVAVQRRGAQRVAAREVKETVKRPAVAATVDAEGAVSPEDAPSLKSVSQTVRVDIRRLDRLMNLVGELALIRMTMQSISDRAKRDLGFAPLAEELHRANRAFERRLSELQAGIMEVRMVPLANLFERMVRVGRKMARDMGKEVRIEIEGENTELDKLIVEDLADPLMHLIRNALDHGIESPDARAAARKPAEGVVRLSAAALGNHVVVQVTDDGGGIDVERTLQLGIERGLVTADRAAEMTAKEAYQLLFLPGFSTATVVTEYSGRGVGLDVVKNNISRLSGVIEIDSRPGHGTTLTITLPITLAIIPALIVSVAGKTYAIPLNNVQETLELRQRDMKTIERREVISVRGSTVPVLDLRTVFALSGTRGNIVYGVLVGIGESRMALLVDELVGQQDIVIKSLGRRLQVKGVAGATELGNQQTILVIDTVELLNEMMAGRVERRLVG